MIVRTQGDASISTSSASPAISKTGLAKRIPLEFPFSFRVPRLRLHYLQLTALTRALRADEAFSLKAFAATLGVIDDDSLP
jgi:hypothetical protein